MTPTITDVRFLSMLTNVGLAGCAYLGELAPGSPAHEAAKLFVHELHLLTDEKARLVARAAAIADVLGDDGSDPE